MRKACKGIAVSLLYLSLSPGGKVTAGNLHSNEPNFLRKGAVHQVAVEARPFREILQDARKHFKVDFLYESGLIPNTMVEMDPKKFASVEKMLDALLTPYQLKYQKVLKDTYAIFSSTAQLNNILRSLNGGSTVLNTSAQWADTTRRKISGKVTDGNTGVPLEGVSILVKGQNTGTTTNATGNFVLEANLNRGDMLEATLVGYQPYLFAWDGSNSISIQMSAKNEAMEEVVVVGFGTAKRKELTTAVGSINAKEINSTPVADAAQALQGRVAGVTILQNSGAPGGTGGTQIRIRGISSINGTNNPLIVLDGFPLPDQSADNILNSFSPNEIERIDVLKDAAAAAIYGVRASNGVVMITTKRGKAGKANINVDMYRGVQKAWSLPSMLNAREYAILNSEARIASGLPVIPKLANPDEIEAEYGEGTNWLGEIFRQAAISNVSMNITGGTDKAQYAFSAGYFRQDGIIFNSDFERFSLRFNSDMTLSPKIKIGNSLSLSKMVERGVDTYSPFNSVLILALTSPPTVRPRNPDGSYAGGLPEDGFAEPNPVYNLEVPQNLNTRYRLLGNVFATYEPVKNLILKVNLGGDYLFQQIRGFSPATPSTGGRPITITGLFEQTNFNPSYLTEFTGTYSRRIGDHNLTGLVGYTIQDNKFTFLGASRNGYTRTDLPVLDDGAVTITNLSQIGNFGGNGRNRLLSALARVNYDYKGKYFFTASFRNDGSSVFGPDRRYANLPSFSVAWRASDEPFLSDISWLSELKVRASYGFTGNPNAAAFAFLSRINTGIQYPLGSNGGASGATSAAAPTATPNPGLGWEKNEQMNIGIDAAMLNNRLNVTLDVYKRTSIDLISQVRPPSVSGTFESILLNTGNMENTGIDLGINSVNVETKDFQWSTNAMFTAFRNRVTSLGLGAPINNGFQRIQGGALRVDVGFPVNYFYGFRTAGIFQNQQEVNDWATQVPGTDPATSTAPGDIRFEDINKDGVINDLDRTNLGNSFPAVTYGLTNTFRYKNFELSVFLQGSEGNKVLNFSRWYTEGGVSNGNYSRDVIGRWVGENVTPAAGSRQFINPRLILNDPNQNQRVSDRFVEDASYLRIKNLRLGFNVPASWARYLSAGRIQLYASAQNLLTVTNYTGFDPEVGGGVDYGFYPQPRTFLFGINVDFK